MGLQDDGWTYDCYQNFNFFYNIANSTDYDNALDYIGSDDLKKILHPPSIKRK